LLKIIRIDCKMCTRRPNGYRLLNGNFWIWLDNRAIWIYHVDICDDPRVAFDD